MKAPENETAMARRRQQTPLGFTLVEILVAMAIFAIVAGLAFAALRFVAREQESLTRSTTLEATAAACLDRMARDLSSIYVVQPPIFTAPLVDDPPSEFRVTGGTENRGAGYLHFASLAHVSFEDPPRRGIARIGYTVQAGAAGSRLIRRSDHLFPDLPDDAVGQDPVLCENVKAAAFYFYDPNGQPSENWDSASEDTGYASPRAVRVVLTFAVDGRERAFETTIFLPVQRRPLISVGDRQ